MLFPTLPPQVIEPITLIGDTVTLEPLATKHHDGLCAAVRDGELWKLHFTFVPSPDEVTEFIERTKLSPSHSEGLAFAVIDKNTHNVIGSTAFRNANLAFKKIEIGNTFFAKHWQRTRANTEAKSMMLQYAFEELELGRVELLTDYLNHKSQQAILRLGAKQEGIIRNHALMPSGRYRDTIIYSIIASEWRSVKEHLQYKLSQS